MEDQVGATWVSALKQELDSASDTANLGWSLYQLPLKLRFRSPSEHLYTPNVVSIGPLHHGDTKFASMEKQKLRYMASFLRRNRISPPENTLMDCAQKILCIESQVKKLYCDILSSQGSGSGNLAKLLLVDGCFTIELLIRSYKADAGLGASNSEVLCHPIFHQDTDSDDPLLNASWTQFILRLDLALLENQIPFFVLEDLFREIAGNESEQLPNDFLATMAFNFLKPLLQNVCLRSAPVSGLGEPRTHLLHLLLNTYQQPEEVQEKPTASVINIDNSYTFLPERKYIPSASELKNSGIPFKVAPNKNLVDIKFINGVFEIPPLHLTECTESFLSNFMAFEFCLKNRPQNVASYVALMSQLMRSPEDVNFLEAQGIIVNGLGNGVGFCLMFHRLATQNRPVTFSFNMLSDEVNMDLEQRRSFPKKFKRGYLPNLGNVRIMFICILLFIVSLGFIVFFILPDMISNSAVTSLLIFAYAVQKLYKELNATHVQFS